MAVSTRSGLDWPIDFEGRLFTARSRSLLDQVRQGRTEGRHKKRER